MVEFRLIDIISSGVFDMKQDDVNTLMVAYNYTSKKDQEKGRMLVEEDRTGYPQR